MTDFKLYKGTHTNNSKVAEMKAGSVYAVCSGNDVIHAKLGFTTHPCPEQYCINTYARMLPNLQIIRIEPVENGRLGETMLFELLQKFRVMLRREIFAIRVRSTLHHAFDEVLKFFAKVREMDPDVPKASFLSLDEYEATQVVHKFVKKIFSNVVKTYSECEEDKKTQEEATAKTIEEKENDKEKQEEAATRNREEEGSKKARLSEKIRSERRDEEVVRVFVSKIFKRILRSHRTSERKEKFTAEMRAEKFDRQNRDDLIIKQVLERFVETKCVQGELLWVNSTVLLNHFNDFSKPLESIDAVQLKRVMQLVGFVYAINLGPRNKVRGYRGLAIQP